MVPLIIIGKYFVFYFRKHTSIFFTQISNILSLFNKTGKNKSFTLQDKPGNSFYKPLAPT